MNGYWKELSEKISDVQSMEVYKGGTVIVKRAETGAGGNLPEGADKRGAVRSLSKKAMCRLLFVATETKIEFKSMMTLTYGMLYPRSGQNVKEDLNRLLTAIRTRCTRKELGKFSYLWFLEFQKRGAPHVHILATILPGSGLDRADFAKMWRVAQKLAIRLRKEGCEEQIIISEVKRLEAVHKHASSWEKIKSDKGATRYVAKYALKTSQKTVPTDFQDVGRFFGWSRDVADGIEPAAEVVISEDELREFLKGNGHRTADFDVLPKYIFGGLQAKKNVSRET